MQDGFFAVAALICFAGMVAVVVIASNMLREAHTQLAQIREELAQARKNDHRDSKGRFARA